MRGGYRYVQPGLDPLDALQQGRLGVAGGGQQQSRADHLKQQTRCRRTAHFPQPGLYHLGVSGQGRRSESDRLLSHPVQYVLGRIDDAAACRVGDRLQHDEIAEALEEVDGKPARVVAGVDHRFDRTEQRGSVRRGQGVDRVVDQCDVGGAQQSERPLVGDAGTARAVF